MMETSLQFCFLASGHVGDKSADRRKISLSVLLLFVICLSNNEVTIPQKGLPGGD